MMRIKTFYVVFIALILFSCAEKEPGIEIKVVRHAHLAGLPSASGIEYANKHIYIAGDDIRWLLTLNNHWEITDSLALSAIDTLVNNRTPGSIKADFESIAHFTYQNNSFLMILSSGSKQITRDTAYLVNFSDDHSFIKKNVRPLYEKIKQLADVPQDNEINIEGLAVSESTVYMFHRGNVSKNFVVTMKKDSLMNYFVSNNARIPKLRIYKFELPAHDGVSSGFSGACIVPGQNGLLFTASLEDTESELADGTILGSYIGYMPFTYMDKGTTYTTLLENANKNPVNTKLESIVIKSAAGNKMTALAVSDNDDGSSDIFKIEITLNDTD